MLIATLERADFFGHNAEKKILSILKAEEALAAFRNCVLEIEMPAMPIPEVKKRSVDITG